MRVDKRESVQPMASAPTTPPPPEDRRARPNTGSTSAAPDIFAPFKNAYRKLIDAVNNHFDPWEADFRAYADKCSRAARDTQKLADTTYTDADLERAVRAALEAAAEYVATHEVGVNPRLGYVIGPSMLGGTLGRHDGMAYADAIRALDPAAIVASVKRGEGE